MCKYCEILEKELKIPADVDGKIVSYNILEKLAEVGRRLEKCQNDNYALLSGTSLILNLFNLAAKNEDNRYEIYFPLNKKTGKRKKPSFVSEFFCQKPREKYLPVYKTETGIATINRYMCAKPWTCPVCGAKISCRRNQEIKQILKKAHKSKKLVFLLTLTAPHYCTDKILTLTEKMQDAYIHFANSATWKRIKKRYCWFGSIKAMETMLGGENGTNNHFHVIEIFNVMLSDLELSYIKWELLTQWKNSCIKAGLLDESNQKQCDSFEEYAVKLKRDFDPDYITKQSEEWKKEHDISETWTVAEECTLTRQKKGAGSCTPFGFVANICRRAAAGGYRSIGNLLKDCELYIEYSCAMYGRSQYQFSRGLRDWAGLKKKKSDGEICYEWQKHGTLLGGFDQKQYEYILRYFLYKPIKTALFTDSDKAISIISRFFVSHGFKPFYSPDEMKSLISGEACSFPEFDEPSTSPSAKPKLAERNEVHLEMT